MRIFRSKIRLLVVAAFVFLTLLGTAYLLLHDSPNRRFSRAYRQLQLGMTQDDIRELFGPTPDFDCRYKSYEIWYYRSPDLFFTLKFDDIGLKRGEMVQSLDDLPDVYDHVQFAFDTNGRLHAYTWIGESCTVQCVNGPVEGSHFSKLAPSGVTKGSGVFELDKRKRSQGTE